MSRLLPAAAVFVLLAASCEPKVDRDRPKDAPVKAKPGPPVAVDAGGLWLAYDENEADADARYLKQTVEVTGSVVDVRKDARGYHARLLTAEGPHRIDADVSCYFPDAKTAADLKHLDQVVVRGVCSGKRIAAATWKGWRVTVDGCQLIQLDRKK